MSITSITVEKGYLCWCWFEEAFQVTSEDDFNKIDMSIRGELPEGYFKQITLTLNPWSEKHWIKKRFFDKPDSHTLSLQTNYTCNEFLGKDDITIFEKMKNENPRRYNIEGLGNWGITEGLVYDNVHIDYRFELTDMVNYKTVCGMDFGYTNDPTAFFIGFLDEKNKALYIWDELYEKGLTNRMIYDRLVSMGYGKESIVCDSAEPKSIAELRGYGLRAKAAVKGKDSISHGIQYIQGLTIYIHPRCVNFTTEIQNYTFDKDKFGNAINQPIDDFNHLMDAMRYALEKYAMGRVTIKTFK